MLFGRLHGGELGAALAPVMEPKLGRPWPRPHPHDSPTTTLRPVWAILNLPNIPSLSSSPVVSSLVGTAKGGKTGSLISPTHSTSSSDFHTPALCKRTFSPHQRPGAARGPQGPALLGVQGYRGTKSQGLSAKGRGRKRQTASARQPHGLKCGSGAKVRRDSAPRPGEQKCPVSARPRADHRGAFSGEKMSPVRAPKGREEATSSAGRSLLPAGKTHGGAGAESAESGVGASPGDGGALGPQTKIKVTDRRAGSRVEPEAGRAARMRATRPRQTLGTRTELPELQRAGKPGLAMPRGRQAGARQRTPQAPAGLGRGRLGAAAHRSRSRRRRQGRKTGRKGTEARLEASAPSAPARKSRGHGSEGGSFGSRNRPRDWTYSEEQQ